MGNDAIYNKLIEMQAEISTMSEKLDAHLESCKTKEKRWYDNLDKVITGAIGAVIVILLNYVKCALGLK